jgi:hypothetical protein
MSDNSGYGVRAWLGQSTRKEDIMRRTLLIAALVGGSLMCGCDRGRKGSAGFHMPDGDPQRGQVVFVDLKCNACHRVAGVNLPAPVAEPPIPVILGGKVREEPTDGELVAAVVDPSHELAPGYPPESLKSGKLSRMGDFSEAMSVRDLIDVVAFLHSRYEVMPPPVVK